MNSRKTNLVKILKDLNTGHDIEGSAAITRDGLLIASSLPEDVDAQILAAMSATMTGAAETAISELKKGLAEKVIVESKQAKLITTGAGLSAILVALAAEKANLGLVLVGMEKAAKQIAEEVK